MFRRHGHASEELRCSFCHKSQDVVAALFSSPGDLPRVYICDECVKVCTVILKDYPDQPNPAVSKADSEESQRLLNHSLTPELLAAVERWIIEESLGADAAEAFAKVRAIAIRWMRPGPER